VGREGAACAGLRDDDAGAFGERQGGAVELLMPAMRVASVAFGKKTSMWPERSRRPISHRSDGSQFGSTEVVAPPERANSAGSSGARVCCRK
jgi:hypothetical protein